MIDKLTRSEKTALTLLVAGQVLSIFTWYLGTDLALTIVKAMPWIKLCFAVVASAALDMVVVTTTIGRRDGRRSGWSWATILSAALFSAAIALDVAGGPSLGAWLHVGYAVNIFLFAQHVAQPRQAVALAPSAPASAPLEAPATVAVTVSAPERLALEAPAPTPLLATERRYECPRCGVALASKQSLGAAKTNGYCKSCKEVA